MCVIVDSKVAGGCDVEIWCGNIEGPPSGARFTPGFASVTPKYSLQNVMLALPVSRNFYLRLSPTTTIPQPARIIDIQSGDQYLIVAGRCTRSLRQARNYSVCSHARLYNL